MADEKWEIEYHQKKIEGLLGKRLEDNSAISRRLNLQTLIVGLGAGVLYLEAVLGAGTVPWYNSDPQTAGCIVFLGGGIVLAVTAIARWAFHFASSDEPDWS